MDCPEPVIQATDTLAIPIVVLGDDGRVLYVNATWRRSASAWRNTPIEGLDNGDQLDELLARSSGRWAVVLGEALADVLTGRSQSFRFEYQVVDTARKRRFLLLLARQPDSSVIVLQNVELTPREDPVSPLETIDWVFERCLDTILVVDAVTLRLLHASTGARRNLQLSSTAVLACALPDIEVGSTHDSLLGEFSPLLGGDCEQLLRNTVFRREDGSTYPVRIQAQQLAVDDHQVIVCIAEDLSSGGATDDLLRHAHALLETSPDAMTLVDAEGLIRAANSQTSTLFGYRPEELLGMSVETLIPDRLRTRHLAMREQFDKNPTPRRLGSRVELRALTKTQEEIPVDVSLHPIIGSDGVLIAATIRDARDKRLVMEKVNRSNLRYQELLHNASDIIHVVRADGHFDYANPAWHRVLGYREDHLASMTIFDLVVEDERDEARRRLSEVLDGKRIGQVRRRFVTRDGETRVFEGTAMPQTMDDGSVTACAIMHDVTDRERVEKTLSAARDAAEQATAAKSRFLAAASHDLRQPLQTLGVYLAVLRRRSHDKGVTEVTEKMQTALDAMGSLLDALLDISKFESGSIKPSMAVFNLTRVLENAVQRNLSAAERKGLSLSLSGAPAWVQTDAALLERILDNLIGNAIRYTESGSVSVAVRRVGEDIVVSVTDTGVGIDAKNISRIFDEFFQAGNAPRDHRKGLGLGLSIVRHISQLLDLSVDVSSSPGEGSTFSVTIPHAHHGEQDGNRPAQVSDIDPSGAVGRGRVLLVEDDVDVRDATYFLLTDLGYNVVAAGRANEALAALEGDWRPAAIITDYRLPGRNGVEVIGHVREALSEQIPAILISGDMSIISIVNPPPPDCTLLHKPVNTTRLIEQLRIDLGEAPTAL